MTQWKKSGCWFRVPGKWERVRDMKQTHTVFISIQVVWLLTSHEFLHQFRHGESRGEGTLPKWQPAFGVKLPTGQDICEISGTYGAMKGASFWSSRSLRSVPGSKNPWRKKQHWDETNKLSDTYIILCYCWDKSYIYGRILRNYLKSIHVSSYFNGNNPDKHGDECLGPYVPIGKLLNFLGFTWQVSTDFSMKVNIEQFQEQLKNPVGDDSKDLLW